MFPICLLVYQKLAHPTDNLIRIIHIREEAIGRPTESLRSPDQDGVYYARDGVAGGTSLAINLENGRFACLNNLHVSENNLQPVSSRGLLPLEFVKGTLDVHSLGDRKFLPFRLFCVPDARSPPFLLTSPPGRTEEIESEIFVIGNRIEPEGRVIEADNYFRLNGRMDESEFLVDRKFLVPPQYSESLKGIAATRSQTVAEISDQQITIKYRTIDWVDSQSPVFSDWTTVSKTNI